MTADLTGSEARVAGPRPQDDLYACVNAQWRARTRLAPGQTGVSNFTVLQRAADERVRELLAGGRIGDRALVAKIEAFERGWLGADGEGEGAALADLRTRTGRLAGHQDFFRWCGEAYRLGVVTPVRHYVDAAPGEPPSYRSHFVAPGPALPLDAYGTGASRVGYPAAVAAMMAEAGAGPGAVRDVTELEAEIAAVHRAAPARTGAAVVHRLGDPRTDLPALALFLDGAGIPAAADGRVGVEEPETIRAITAVLSRRPPAALRHYALWCAVSSLAPCLTEPVATAWADLNRATGTQKWLSGDRGSQARYLVSRAFGHALGHAYAAHSVDRATREGAADVVRGILAAYRDALASCAWLGADARAAVLEKLDRVGVSLVAPERPRDHTAVEIRGELPLADYHALVAHDVASDLARIGTEVSADHWKIRPSQANAYYDARAHRIAIPAAMLRPPLFDVDDLPGSLGGFGAVVAHELTHAFDERTIRIAADGSPHTAWGAAEERAYAARGAAVARQFDAYRRQDHPGLSIDGTRTRCENLADLAGLSVALRAWTRHCRDAGLDAASRRSGTREVFTGWARLWRQRTTPSTAAALARSDPHAPGEARCNQIARNLDAFHRAFGVGPGDDMWLAPSERVRLW